MKQNISTLMDGELCSDEAEILLGKIKLQREAQQEWLTYHLIGDAMRQPDCIRSNLSQTFSARLQAEPTVFAPQIKRGNKVDFYAMSAVASIMAMAFLAWFSLQNEPLLQHEAQRNTDSRTVRLPFNEGMNDYLRAHQEFSPGTDVRGAASYIRTVAFDQSGVRQ